PTPASRCVKEWCSGSPARPRCCLSFMEISPGFSTFAREYESGRGKAVFLRLVADLETPVSVFLKLADGKDNSFLLESVQGGEARGRYSIIGFNPDLIWRCRDGKAELQHAEGFVPDKDS